MDLFVIVLLLMGTLLFRWYRNRKNRFTVFKSNGIQGPEPNIFFGNLAEMKDVGQHKKWMDWMEVYGKTYGYYEGPKAVLVTSDVELLKHIMIKEFNKFHSRKPFPMHNPQDKFNDMFSAQGQHWKRIRAISSPSFSTRRMKEMSPLIHHSITDLLDVLDKRKKAGKPFNIFGEFQKMTLTVIANVAFGIEVGAMTDPDDVFLKQVRKIFLITEEKTRSWVMTIFIPMAVCFPEPFHMVWRYIQRFFDLPRNWFLDAAKRILHARMNTKCDRVDFVQLMLDARLTDTPQDLTMTVDENEAVESAQPQNEKPEAGAKTAESKNTENKTSAKKLSMEEMQSQCMLFLLAGYETTSTALGFMAHIMAIHPDVQDKLQAEIDKHFPDAKCKPDYASVQKLPYMDMVLCETLRMYPIAAIATTREATQDILLEGVSIKKGMLIQVNMEAVHFDPEHWGPEDPKDFVPERFLPERKFVRHPCAWLPFGIGPRNCVGMRFALLEAKLTLVRLLKNYSVERCDETKIPLPVNNIAIRGPSEGVWVKLVRR